ncbi:MAG: hypothetical protein IKC11_03640, partial [Clostridia bacterium]|nr:hypothetical protein [Clostridia bacterium]
GHNYRLSGSSSPSCESDGYDEYECSNCGDSYTETIEATGHDYDSDYTGPTCEEDGYYTHTCSNCGDSYETSGASATGHSYELVDEGGGSNCQDQEWEEYECSYCGDSYTTWGGYGGHDYDSDYTGPTCEEDGYYTYSCKYCSESYTEPGRPATGHNWDYLDDETEECTSCGATRSTHGFIASGGEDLEIEIKGFAEEESFVSEEIDFIIKSQEQVLISQDDDLIEEIKTVTDD